jgi:histidinol-phosphate aminotransferase
MRSLWDLSNPQLRDLAVYQPGKPIGETARELGCNPAEIIKLASNENALGPSPKAVAAIRNALGNAQLYPDGGGCYLREALAAHLGFSPQNIILGNGSNEVIEFLAHAFVRPGDEIITSEHAFIAYKIIATVFGALTIEVASPDYRPNLDAMVETITPKTHLIFVANPNNPTGTLATQDEIDRFMSRLPEHVVAVFDEAYHEFVDHPPDTLQYVGGDRNIIVLRTFSKIHGLAGLRVGYGVARAELIEVLQKTRQPFNVNALAQAAALAALEDDMHQRKSKNVVDAGRAYLQEQFADMGLTFIPSYGNFVMVRVGDGPAVFRKLLTRKIIVRALKGYKLPEWIRVTFGTMEQNQRFIAALREVLHEPE